MIFFFFFLFYHGGYCRRPLGATPEWLRGLENITRLYIHVVSSAGEKIFDKKIYIYQILGKLPF